MGHIVEHAALELQELAGMLVGFGRTGTATRSLSGGNRYLDEQAGRYAGSSDCAKVLLIGVIIPKKELEQDLQDRKTSTEMPR